MSQKPKPSDRQNNDTAQSLLEDIKQLAEFVKSLSLSLPKEARRILNLSNLQKNRTFMMSLVDNQKLYKFTEFQEYAGLVSKQTKNRIDQQVHQPLLNLQGKLKTFQFNQKKAEKQRQLAAKTFQTTEKTEQRNSKKNQKLQEPVTFELCLKQFEEIRNEFAKIWKEEYFLMMNYRMAITAKEIERWTQIAGKKSVKEDIVKEIEELFL